MPVVDQRRFRAPHHEKMRPVAFVAVDNEPGADQPVRVVDAAGKTEPAGKPPAALDRGGDAFGVERCRHDRIRIFAPDVFLRREREGAEHLRVIGHDRLDPALGAVAAGQPPRDIAQYVPPHFVAAEPGRLGHARQARLFERRDRCRRHAARRLRCGGAVPQDGPQRIGAGVKIERRYRCGTRRRGRCIRHDVSVIREQSADFPSI